MIHDEWSTTVTDCTGIGRERHFVKVGMVVYMTGQLREVEFS